MKKLTIAFGILLLAGSILAQVPQSFKYQAIARDTDGTILSNKNIAIRISILYGNTYSSKVYSETHNLSTSPFGLINLEIGNGENKSGNFSDIDWSKGNYYVNIEIDENGGSDFVSMGSSQLLSVPYALYAQNSGSVSESGMKEADSWTEATGVTYLTNPNNVGIGTTVPVSKLHVTGSGINAVYERNISTAAGPANRFYKSRGTASSKTQVQAGDNLGQFQFWGMGDDGAYDIGATLKGVAESTRTGTDIFDVAGSIQFLTTNTSFSWGERMRITADGDVGIGTSAPAGILDIAGAYHFPSVDGTSGQVLQTNGSGTLSWGDGGATDINSLSDGKTDNTSVFLGSGAGANDDANNYNVGVGIGALSSNIGGTSNVANGYCSLYSNTTGYYNTAIGRSALQNNTTGYWNTAIGAFALASNTTGSMNTATGYNTLVANTTGIWNTATGAYALYKNTTGIGNTAIGEDALKDNTEGSYNTAIGVNALWSNTTGVYNTAIGKSALFLNTTGFDNIAIGRQSLYDNTIGLYNVAIGGYTLGFNKSGYYNTALGFAANYKNQEGSRNTIIGYQAGYGTSEHSKAGCVFLGYQAGYYDTTDNKLYIENSNSTTPLLYGEFDNDLLRVNGTLDINNAYQFPTSDGSSGQVLQTNGSGALSWTTISGSGGDFSNGGEAGGTDRSLGNTDNYALGLLTNNETRLYIKNDGKIGIGTSNPSETLYIKGTGTVRATIETTTINGGSASYRMVRPDNTAWAAFDFAHPGANQWGFGLRLGFNGLSFWDATAGDAVRLCIQQTTGYIGIGTTAPAGILDIAGAYHFPSVDGTNGQVLQTNGSGALSWANAGSGASAISSFGYCYYEGAVNIASGDDIPFSGNGPLSGITHTAGSTDITVPNTANYKVDFSVNFNIENSIAIFGIAVNDAEISYSKIKVYYPVVASYGTLSGIVILSLNAGDVINVRNYRNYTADIEVDGAQLAILQLD